MPKTLTLLISLSALAAGQTTPPENLLKDVAARPAMSLNAFQQIALSQNPTLRLAKSFVAQSAAQARQAGLYPNPSAGYQGEQIRGGSYGGGEQGGFVSQTFVLGGKLGLRRNIFEQQRRQDELTVSEQHYRVLSNVSQSFYSALAAQEIVNLRRRLLSLANDAVETAHQLANVGQADQPDVLQAEVEEEQASVDYTTAQRAYLQSFINLAALVGKPELPVSPLAGDLERFPDVDAGGIINRILLDSPSVKRAQQGVVQAEAALKSARREAVPDVQIQAGLQQNFEPLGQIPGPVGVQGFATAGVTLPIFNRNQGNIAAARAEVERANAEATRIQLSLRQSTQPMLQAFLAGRSQAERYKTQMIPRAQRAYQLYLAKYQEMGAAYPQVLVSQRTFFQLQVGYINALESVWMNAIALQNYGLTSGLSSPEMYGSYTTNINLPNREQ